VQLVIADTGPVNYLVLIGHIAILPEMFEKVILPSIVRDELAKPKAPLPVRNWIANAPAWVEVRHTAGDLEDVSRLSAF
jgi:predicted nucleic acid-binding protein